MLETINANSGLLALLAAVIVLIVGFVLLGKSSRQLRRERERLRDERREKGEYRINRAVGDSARQVAELSGAVDARLDALEKQVGEKLDARLSESFRLVNGQLADVHRGIGEMRVYVRDGMND